jgi:hypothetical protein
MTTLFSSPLILLCLFALLPGTVMALPAPGPLPATPANLEVSAGQTLALVLTARGVQIYECRPVPGDPARFEWAFKAPEADLFDAQGRKVGRHSAGPTWELTDGGKVVGRVKAMADAPDGQGIAWLLLEAVKSSGGGIMGKVRSIQRVGTVGGKAPAEPAGQTRVGQESRVEYTATYKFYIAAP